MIQQGHIITVPFPYSDLTATKLRPALVVSNARFNDSSDVIAVAISRAPSTLYGVELDLEDFERGSLTVASFIHCQKIHQLEKSMIKGIIAKVKPDLLQKVLSEIQSYLQ